MQVQNLFAQDASGNVIPSPVITVRLRGTNTLATGLKDINNADLSNPFTGGLDGLVSFAAPDGEYDVTAEGDGRTRTLVMQFSYYTLAAVSEAQDAAATATEKAAEAAQSALQLSDAVSEAQQAASQATSVLADAATASAAVGVCPGDEISITDQDGFAFFTVSPDGRAMSKSFDSDLLTGVSVWISDDVNGASFTDEDGFVVAELANASKLSGVNDVTARAQSAAALSYSVSAMPGHRVMIGMDSRSEQNTIGAISSGVDPRLSDFGYFGWANFFAGGGFDLAYNSGIGGNKASDYIARLPAVISAHPEVSIAVVFGGVNDVIAGRTTDEIMNDLVGIYTMLLDAGIRVVAMTEIPFSTASTHYTPARNAQLLEIGARIRKYAAATTGIVLADIAKVFIDPLSATCQPKAGYQQSDDGIHPSPAGAAAIGRVLADALLSICQPIDWLPCSIADAWDYSGGGQQLHSNPLFVSSGGTTSNPTAVSGQIPAGCSISTSAGWGSGTISTSLIARADGLGNCWTVTVSSAPAGGLVYLSLGDVYSRAAPGDYVFTAVGTEIIDAGGMIGLRLMTTVTVDGATTYKSVGEWLDAVPTAGTTAWVEQDYPQDSYSGVLKTQETQIPTGSALTSLKPVVGLRFLSGGHATIKLSRCGIFNI